MFSCWGIYLLIGAIVLLWLFIRHRGQISTIVNSAPLISKLLGGNFTILPGLLKTQNVSLTSTSMPNLTHQIEISSTLGQSYVC